jgi:hypothetical protein
MAYPASQATPMPRSVVSSLSSRQALPKRCDILPEGLIGSPIRPQQREQNRHLNIGEHRRDGDLAAGASDRVAA